MSYRAMALVAASLLFVTQSCAETTTVKNSKSGTSDRMGGGGGTKGAAGSATPANTDRTGGGGGGKGAVQLNPQPEPPGRTK